MALSLKQLQDVCLLYDQEGQCRYLRQDVQTYDKWYCVKQKKIEKAKVDNKVDEMMLDCAQKGIDPSDTGVPFNDNCDGYPILKYVEQGYDV